MQLCRGETPGPTRCRFLPHLQWVLFCAHVNVADCMMFWLCVLVRIVANPLSNVLQKVLAQRAASPHFIICATHGLLSLVCIPVLLLYPPPLVGEFWWNMGLGSLLTVAGNVLIVAALRRADLSLLGPVNSYKAVISLVPGMILLHEFPDPAGFVGILLIVAGSLLIVSQPGHGVHRVFARLWSDRGVQFRLAAVVLSATEAVFMKKALLASSAQTTFAVWCVLGFVVSLVVVLSWSKRLPIQREMVILRGSWPTYALLSLTTGLMQLCTAITFNNLQVGYSLALFQTSTLIAVFLGHTIFHEPHFIRRIAGAVVMALGAAFIVMAR